MTSVLPAAIAIETLVDLLKQLGGIAPDRVRFRPAPGTATEEDVLESGHCVESHLMEFPETTEPQLGYWRSCMIRLASGLVRIPDVAFISWDRLPNRRIPTEPIPGLAPDLAVAILSASHTTGEMVHKRQEYLAAGVQLLWVVDPDVRIVIVYTATP